MGNINNGQSGESIVLTATSDYSTAGKQFIGRVTGQSARFGTDLDFVGAVRGKRRDVTSLTVIDPGLYKLRCTTRKGASDEYVIVWRDGAVLRTETVGESVAFRMAKEDLTNERLAAAAIAEERRVLNRLISDMADNDLGIRVSGDYYGSDRLGLTNPTYGELREARRRRLATLDGDITSDRPIELDALPSDPAARRRSLEAEREKLMSRLSEIEVDLAALLTA